jgi:hypothetical protein
MRPGLLALCLTVLLGPGLVLAQSVSDSDFLAIEPFETTVFLNADTQFTTAILLDNATSLGQLVIPLSFAGLAELNIDTTVVTSPGCKGVTFGPSGSGAVWTIRTSEVDNTAKTIMIQMITFTGLPPANDTLCYLHWGLDSTDQMVSIDVDSTTVGTSHLTVTDRSARVMIPTWTAGTIRVDASIGVGDPWTPTLPLSHQLQPNYPNPFNASTMIRFSLDGSEGATPVTLAVYNSLGQTVRTLLAGTLPAGDHEVRWDGTDDAGRKVASGIFFARLHAGDYQATRKMLLLQ